jgi:hypothetical protein
MKKIPYNDYLIQIVTDEEESDIVKQFFNGIESNKTKGFIYICDNSRYPKRVAKKIGEFYSNGNTTLNFNDYMFEKGKWIVYLNSKGNFYIYLDKPEDFSKRCRS